MGNTNLTDTELQLLYAKIDRHDAFCSALLCTAFIILMGLITAALFVIAYFCYKSWELPIVAIISLAFGLWVGYVALCCIIVMVEMYKKFNKSRKLYKDMKKKLR